MRARRLVGLAAGLALLCAGSLWYARPIAVLQTIGISWRTMLSTSHCARFHQEVSCTTDWPPTGTLRSAVLVDYDRVSRRILRAERRWVFDDSTVWRHTLDSTVHSVSAANDAELPCDTAATHFPTAQAWRAGQHEIRVYAEPERPVSRADARPYLSVQLLPFGADGCGPRYVTRLITGAELARAAEEWMAEQIGIK